MEKLELDYRSLLSQFPAGFALIQHDLKRNSDVPGLRIIDSNSAFWENLGISEPQTSTLKSNACCQDNVIWERLCEIFARVVLTGERSEQMTYNDESERSYRVSINVLDEQRLLVFSYETSIPADQGNFIRNGRSVLTGHKIKSTHSEPDFRAFFETIDDLVLVSNLEGNILYANSSVTKKLGFLPSELLRKQILDLHPASKRCEAEQIFREMFLGKRTLCPLPLQTKTGDLFPVETRVWFGLWQGMQCVFGISRDLSREQEAQQRFERLFQHSPILMAVSSAEDRRIIDVNECFLRVLGYTREDVIGKSSTECGVIPDAEKLDTISQSLCAEGRISELELAVRCKDGTLLDGLFSGELINSQGHTYFLTCMIDITHRKRSEKRLRELNEQLAEAAVCAEGLANDAKRASLAKSEFLASMSHEIRTPLNGIVGTVDLLSGTPLSQEQRRYVDALRYSSDSLLSLITEVLDFSKIEAGKEELDNIEFDFGDLLEDVVDSFADRAHSKGLELCLLIEPAVRGIVLGDPGKLRQIVSNLVGNAIKFTSNGEVAVYAELFADDGVHSSLRVAVRDTGIGIPLEKIGAIFEKFSQIDASTTREFGGTGLGLAISKRLLELMEGTIGVESKVGKGSVFWFTAKLEKPAFGNIAQRGRTRTEQSEIEGAKVLVVDKSETSRNILMSHLSRYGARVSEAPDTLLALRYLYAAAGGNDPFRFLLIDTRPPCIDGEAFIRSVRADQINFSTLSIVAVSSSGMPGEASQASEMDANAYIAKPVRERDLVRVLSTLSGSLMQEKAALAPQTKDRVRSELVVNHSAREFKETQPQKIFERGHRVLLVEDNLTNQFVTSSMLSRFGLETRMAENGTDALKLLQSEDFDLVLMDVHMPGMDGFETTRLIRSGNSGVRNRFVPILSITANAVRGNQEKCLSAGMTGYLSKPFSARELAKAVAKFIPEIGSKNMEYAHKSIETVFCDSVSQSVGFPSGAEGRLWNPDVLLKRVSGDNDLAKFVLESFSSVSQDEL